jgi:hypothetical protein
MRVVSCLLFAALAADADDRPAPDLTPLVEVFVPAIPRSQTAFVFQKAQLVTTGIYDAIGVRVLWHSNGRRYPSGCAGQPLHRTILVTFRASDSTPVNDQALALSHPHLMTGPCITLLMDRLEAAIRLNPVSAYALVGHVLAHELGHVLEGTTRHSDTGLMKERWLMNEVWKMKEHPLDFAPYDSALIRAALGVGPGATGPAGAVLTKRIVQ